MSCKKYQEVLVDYLDKELSKQKSAEVKEHLVGCPECREFAQRLDSGLRVFQAVTPKETAAELSPHLPEKIAARMMDEVHSKRPLVSKFALLFAAACLFIGISTGFALRPYLSDAMNNGQDNMISSLETKNGTFIFHSKDKKGRSEIDLKF